MNVLGDWEVKSELGINDRFKDGPFVKLGHWIRVRETTPDVGKVEVYIGPIVIGKAPVFTFDVVLKYTKTVLVGEGTYMTKKTWISARWRNDGGVEALDGFSLWDRKAAGAEDSGGQWGGRR